MTKITEAEEALGMELMEACKKCDLEKARELISTKGASAAFVNNREGVWGSREKESVLHAALSSRTPGDDKNKYRDWVSLIRLLVENKADVNEKQENYDWRGCGSTNSAFEMMLPFAMED